MRDAPLCVQTIESCAEFRKSHSSVFFTQGHTWNIDNQKIGEYLLITASTERLAQD